MGEGAVVCGRGVVVRVLRCVGTFSSSSFFFFFFSRLLFISIFFLNRYTLIFVFLSFADS